MPKLNTAALELPELVTVADDPGDKVVVVPAVIVAALPVAPCGIPKLNTAAEDDPELLTVADAPGERVVVVPAVIVAADPVAPVVP